MFYFSFDGCNLYTNTCAFFCMHLQKQPLEAMEGDGCTFTGLLEQALYDESFTDACNTQYEWQQPPPIKISSQTSKQNQKQKGKKNFNDDEDILLIGARLNVSMDPTKGTNQTKATFWQRVHVVSLEK
jgi:hypothetical protein